VSLQEEIKGRSEREWPFGRLCVCDCQATGLETTQCLRGDIRSLGRPARADHLGVGGLLPERGGAPRKGVLSSEVDRLSGPVRGPSAALRPSRRYGRAYASGVRVHLLVPVQQGRDLLHHQRTPASSGAARALRICKTL
jgi:hypothetical protein